MQHKLLTLAVLAILLNDFTNGRTKDPDEDRAYEFGFTIEGMQHRHEKKDVNGIIQGEFGFITADGVYHVTVYATDENGNFRILSMKNIKVSPPLDGSPDFGSTKYSSIPKGSQSPSSSLKPVQVQKRTDMSTTRAPNREFTTQSTIKPACAGCGYVTTSKKPPTSGPNEIYSNNRDTSGNGQRLPSNGVSPAGSPNGPNYPNFGGSLSTFQSGSGSKVQQASGLSDRPSGQKTPPNGISIASPLEPTSGIAPLNEGLVAPPTGNLPGSQNLEDRFGGSLNSQQPSLADSFSNPQNKNNDISGPTNSQHSSQITYRNPDPPVKVTNGVIQVPGNPDIPIKDKYPGMVEGLPAGIEEKDITDILYRFNWTVGFQGHYETGYKNGAKVGGYFVNGSDGISRVVTYVADEFGYRPKVKIINIGLDSPDTPKDDKTFVLKSFEFVWYPVK